MRKQLEDLTNHIFGRLTVKGYAFRDKHGNAQWFCVCSCNGTTKVVRGDSLRRGVSKSCGCLQRAGIRERLTTHGHSNLGGKKPPSSTYNSFQAMRRRCLDPNREQYSAYGGNGITVCERWRGKDGFVNFLADLGERPAGTSLGRFGDVGNYEPGNVAWQTLAEQVANRRHDRIRPWSKNKKIKAIYFPDALPIFATQYLESYTGQ
jgi:hypothetical protein